MLVSVEPLLGSGTVPGPFSFLGVEDMGEKFVSSTLSICLGITLAAGLLAFLGVGCCGGGYLVHVMTTQKCPVCGARNGVTARSCHECRFPLR
jgi:hypothetical protein